MDIPTLSVNFDRVEEDWTGLSDQQKRRTLQNRINQRKHRTRKLHARLAVLLPDRQGTAKPRGPVESGGVRIVWDISPARSVFLNTGLSLMEWDLLLYAKDALWPKPCNTSPWRDTDKYMAPQVPIGLVCWHIPENSILRHSILLATSIDLESLSGQDYTTLRLRHANATIKQVRLGIEAYGRQNADSNAESTRSKSLMGREELLFAIMALAKQSRSTSITPLPDTFGLFKPSFPLGLQFLNLWGQGESHQMHHQALKSLVRTRRDLARMEFSTPGFGEVVAQFDLLESAKTLAVPSIEAFPTEFGLARKDVFSSGDDPEPHGKFPQFLRRGSNLGRLLDVLSDIRFYCAWCHILQDRLQLDPIAVERHPRLSIAGLAALRDSIEHRLLSYKFIDNSVEEQLCWTVTLVFTHCVVYPLPNRKPSDTLLDRLRALIRTLDMAARDQEDIVFMTWMSTVAAMACHDSDETRQRLFLETLRTCVDRLAISSWAQMKFFLTGFLWLDRACDTGGLEIWRRLVTLGSVSEAYSDTHHSNFDLNG
ncbi:hypothetical protein PV04_02277 [Phialophora macrospora]|uniref:Uncharacterized protein n=1 Tax=Phialophora macrospora TaxID=1851006 RepID=A0A0D2FTV9_9EURO|nr:hypothetical protein PV04_02277 [Phialophora macrospora]